MIFYIIFIDIKVRMWIVLEKSVRKLGKDPQGVVWPDNFYWKSVFFFYPSSELHRSLNDKITLYWRLQKTLNLSFCKSKHPLHWHILIPYKTHKTYIFNQILTWHPRIGIRWLRPLGMFCSTGGHRWTPRWNLSKTTHIIAS